MQKWFRVHLILLLITCMFIGASAVAQETEPRRVDLSGAEIYLIKFENRVKVSEGKAFKLGSEEQQALQQIKDLYQKYPNNPTIQDFFKRAKVALSKSKGIAMEITPQMLAYRTTEQEIKDKLSKINIKEWGEYRDKIIDDPAFIEKPFPAPTPENISTEDEMTGRLIILEGFEYPMNEFTNNGISYVFIGSPLQGYYYVQTASRTFLGPYEAIKRYKRQVSPTLADKWMVVGKIGNPRMMIPEAGEKTIMKAFWGWVVEPMALYVPDTIMAVYDKNLTQGAKFIGEAEAEAMVKKKFTVTTIPTDVKPGQLVEIMTSAIKEKNFNLYLECIDPEKKEGSMAISKLKYLWDSQQNLFATEYVHVEIYQVEEPVVLSGGVIQADVENFFMEEDEKKELQKSAEPLVEEVCVKVRIYNKLGKVVQRPEPVWLRRIENNRWYIRYGYYF